MPKADRVQKSSRPRHSPLGEDLRSAKTLPLNKTNGHRHPKRKAPKISDGDENSTLLSSDQTKRLLEVAAQQLDELNFELESGVRPPTRRKDSVESISSTISVTSITGEAEPRLDDGGFIISDYLEDEAENEFDSSLKAFLPTAERKNQGPSNLADFVLSRIRDSSVKETDCRLEGGEEIPERVRQLFIACGKLLAKYRSGKLPMPVKRIPRLKNWEEILNLTDPLRWTPHAMRDVTRCFVAGLKEPMAQRYYNLVLLPAVRENIAQYKKLHVHYYSALRKAMFRPNAWFKGILLPLAQENCTVREAMIIASVLRRVSVPHKQAAVGLVKLCQMQPWYATTAYFMSVLLAKGISLPALVMTSLVGHFNSFELDDRELPVAWHRCLLIFVQRYGNAIESDSKNLIRRAIQKHHHRLLTPEIRKALANNAVTDDAMSDV